MFVVFDKMQWFKTKETDGKRLVFDPVRKKYCVLTPEEEVRQKTLYFLVDQLHVPEGLIAVEHAIKLNGLCKRCDIVVFNTQGKAMMIVECKAAHIPISQKTLDQTIRYNFSLQVHYLLLTNGNDCFCFEIDIQNKRFEQLEKIPDFNIINR